VLRKPGGFPVTTNKLFYRKHQSLFPVLFAELKIHYIAQGSGREDKTPATRKKKQHAGASCCHHTEEGSLSQSPGRTRSLAYREYPACIGLKSNFCRVPTQLPSCPCRQSFSFKLFQHYIGKPIVTNPALMLSVLPRRL